MIPHSENNGSYLKSQGDFSVSDYKENFKIFSLRLGPVEFFEDEEL